MHLSHCKAYFYKLRGERATRPALFSSKVILFAWLGSFIAIGAVGLLTPLFSTMLILGSFGASCVILFGYPDAPFAQPRNVIGGHFLSALVGLIVVSLFGIAWWTLGIAVASAVAIMMITNTVHPPAGSNPVIIWLLFSTQGTVSWTFLLFPTLAGAIIITLIAVLYNNATRAGNYPKYWF